jgi:hypothetical protein
MKPAPAAYSVRIRPVVLLSFLIGVIFLLIGQAESLSRPGSRGLLAWDAAGYYAYLPAAFIYRDFSFAWSDQEAGIPRDQFVRQAGDYMLNRYPLGPALMQTPFFLVAHAVAKVSEAPANGYSRPYRQALLIGAAFYGTLGLMLLGLVLSRWFPGYAVMLTLVCLGLGSNLAYYSVHEGMMSHVYSFFLFAFILWSGLRWREDGQRNMVLLLALAGGLVGATRISNVIILIVPLLWGLGQGVSLRILGRELLRLGWRWIPAPLLFLLPLLPQMLYLREITGSYLFSTYGDEHFLWQDPLFGKVLLSFRKGWLVWSPLMVLGLAGWWRLRHHPGFWALTLFVTVNLYVVSSWWCWWYGGGFGMRALIESSAVMAFGMAAALTWLGQQRVRSYVLAILLPWFLALTQLQMHQYGRGIIHWDSMTRQAYWAVFGHVHPAPPSVMERRDRHLSEPDYARAKTDRIYRKSL